MIYPTVAEVQTAPLALLLQWADKLSPPQTDVERTVFRRIHQRLSDPNSFPREEVSAVVHAFDDDLGTRFDSLLDRMNELRARFKPTVH